MYSESMRDSLVSIRNGRRVVKFVLKKEIFLGHRKKIYFNRKGSRFNSKIMNKIKI